MDPGRKKMQHLLKAGADLAKTAASLREGIEYLLPYDERCPDPSVAHGNEPSSSTERANPSPPPASDAELGKEPVSCAAKERRLWQDILKATGEMVQQVAILRKRVDGMLMDGDENMSPPLGGAVDVGNCPSAEELYPLPMEKADYTTRQAEDELLQ